MKYNLDCIRDVLLMLEACLNIKIKRRNDGVWEYEHNEITIKEVYNAMNTITDPPTEPKYQPEEVAYSIEKLKEAGFISVIDDENNPLTLLRIISITYEGHEFLENIRAPKTWEILKERAARAGSCAISFMGALANTVCLDIALGKILG